MGNSFVGGFTGGGVAAVAPRRCPPASGGATDLNVSVSGSSKWTVTMKVPPPAKVTEVLPDPDSKMVQSSIVRHLDRQAADLLERRDYVSWAETMSRAVESCPFLVQRLCEWSLFRAISLAQPWIPGGLTDSSHWLQRKIVDSLDSSRPVVRRRGPPTMPASAGRIAFDLCTRVCRTSSRCCDCCR